MIVNRRAFFANTVWQYALQLVKYVLPLVTLPYLARVLEPTGYALYAYVLALMSYAQVIVEFGFNLSGTKRIAKEPGIGEAARTIGEITVARLVVAAAVLVPVVAFAALAPITKSYLVYTVLSYIAVCGRVLAPDFVFQGREKMGPLTTRYLASKGTSTLLTFLVVHSADDLLWIPILDIVASAIALGWSVAAMRRIFGYSMVRPRLRSVLTELRNSAVYCFSNVAAVTLSGFTTLLIGFVLTDKSHLSYWSLSITAVSAVQALYNPIISSLYPHMIVRSDYVFARRIAAFAAPILATVTLGFAAWSSLLMAILGGSAYREGAYVIALVSPILPLSFYGMFLGWPILGAAGKVKQLTVTTVVAALFCIISLCLLAMAGAASIVSVCVVRDLSELVLVGSRAAFVWRLRDSLSSRE